MIKSKFIKSGLVTLIGAGAIGGVSTAILFSQHQNHSIRMVTDDERTLVSDKTVQKAVESYIALTKWMCQNDVQPNYYHESLSVYADGYATFKKDHSSSDYNKYLISVENTMASNTDLSAWIQADKSNTILAADTDVSKITCVNFAASNDGSFDPTLLKAMVDAMFNILETSFPDMQYDLESIKAVIDMAIDNDWTDKFGIEKVIDGIFNILEQAAPSCYQIFWILNNSIDKIVLTWEDPEEMVRQLDGVFAVAEGEMAKDPTAAIFIGVIQSLNTLLDKVIRVLVPTPVPTPTPDPSILTVILEGFVSKFTAMLVTNYPAYTEYAYIFRDVVDAILEADWNDQNSIARCFDKIFNTLNKFFPSLNSMWFILNNVLDLIVMNNFDRLIVWNELDGLLTLAEGQMPKYKSEIKFIKSCVDTICSDPVKYAMFQQFVKLYIVDEIDKIVHSEYSQKMTEFFWKVFGSMTGPTPDLWWYGQGGNMTQGGAGHYGYELSNKVSYTDNYAWDKVQTGDAIYEEAGFNYITGHEAIVDGIYYDIAHNELYIKGVEACNPDGVEVSVWDDMRVASRGSHIAHIKNVDESVCKAAVEYNYSQLGHTYAVSPYDKPTDEALNNNTASWYCSELVNYSYVQAGYQITDYEFVNKYQHKIDGILVALYDSVKYLDGTLDYTLIPGDMNILDIFAIGVGMVTPREMHSSPLVNNYINA